MPKVLLVEDDPQISKSLKMSLSFSGYDVSVAENIAHGWESVSTTPFDILLLDVNLPDGSGLDLCKKIRAMGHNVPILFLSARTDEAIVVEGMNIGAEDYIRKPFGTEELKVRMNKAMKRAEPERNVVSHGPLKMSIDKRTATLFDQPISLGKREFDILIILAKKAEEVVSREQILGILEPNSELYDRTIDSHMSHLRRKMREAGKEEIQILPVYGVGYRLVWKRPS
ncbi:response regulator transcription factor [Bdellovibrio sp. HCB337]|uniref:response regulator transcription factor n=1 Tax=Bdellovibrio sp. HCB337 TaxID=3394358 RepID=UPI0039A622D6